MIRLLGCKAVSPWGNSLATDREFPYYSLVLPLDPKNESVKISSNFNNIPFSKAYFPEGTLDYVADAMKLGRVSGDHKYTKLCRAWFEKQLKTKTVLMTTSGTHALEMAAILCDIQPGDEVICPSFTFSSSANAFVGRGAKIRFVDIRPDTLNMDEKLVEAAITPKTKAILVMHYAGVACNMEALTEIASNHGLHLVEDAAHAVLAFYRGKALGTFGRFGAFSFHETKNFTSGEGGALIVNHDEDILASEILREKGTNRSQYFRGEIDKYTWMNYGSSFLMSDLNAAVLFPQLLISDVITKDRLSSWRHYYTLLSPLQESGRIVLPVIPDGCEHNAHLFHLRTRTETERDALIDFLKQAGVQASFHYVPLHSSPAGQRFGKLIGEDRYTTRESSRLVRLPLYYGLESKDIEWVCETIRRFFISN